MERGGNCGEDNGNNCKRDAWEELQYRKVFV